MALKIIHRPLGDEHPYEPGADGRWPRAPRVGARFSIGARTEPADPSARVWVSWRIGEEGPAGRVGARLTQRAAGGSATWIAEMPPCPAERLHYRIHADGPAGQAATAEFTLAPRPMLPLGAVSSVRAIGDNIVLLYGEGGERERGLHQIITAAQPGVLKLRIAPHLPEGGEAGAARPREPTLVAETGRSLTFRLGGLRVSVAKHNGALTISDDSGKTVLQEAEAPLVGPGEVEGTLELERCFLAAPAERFYGLGERFHGLNQRGLTVDTLVFEQYGRQGTRSYLPVPFLLSSRGYGTWVDSRRRAVFDLADSRSDRWTLTATGRELACYFFVGKPTAIVHRFTALAGRPGLPPSWAFGPWMSSNEWNSQERVLAEIERGRDLDIPASVVVVEAWSDEQTFYLWNDARCAIRDPAVPVTYADLTMPAEGRWPDPRGMIRAIHDLGMRFVLWQIPVLKPLAGPHPLHEADERYAVENGLCVTEADGSPYRIRPGWFHGGMVIDFTNPSARRWWFDRRRYLVEECGVDGLKTDGGEHLWGNGLRFHDGRRGDEMVNGFPLAYLGAYHEALASWGVEHPLTFSRAGYTGAQRFPCHWAGDQPSTWEAFRSVLNAALNAGISGIPFFGWDMAGFSGEIPTAELYLRSAACAAFSPIMQYHSEFNEHREPHIDRTPWNIADRTGDARVIPVYRLFAKLRMRLLPYIEEEASWCADTGEPLMAPLFLRFPEDPLSWHIDDEYLFGRALLVAPVVAPGMDRREVHLPEGGWEDVWSRERIDGPARLTAPCPIERIPVYRLLDGPWPFRGNPFAEE